MREPERCPICGGRTGRVEERVEKEEQVLVHWHTDLPDKQEYCIEMPDGTKKQICKGHGEPTGPRA